MSNETVPPPGWPSTQGNSGSEIRFMDLSVMIRMFSREMGKLVIKSTAWWDQGQDRTGNGMSLPARSVCWTWSMLCRMQYSHKYPWEYWATSTWCWIKCRCLNDQFPGVICDQPCMGLKWDKRTVCHAPFQDMSRHVSFPCKCIIGTGRWQDAVDVIRFGSTAVRQRVCLGVGGIPAQREPFLKGMSQEPQLSWTLGLNGSQVCQTSVVYAWWRGISIRW